MHTLLPVWMFIAYTAACLNVYCVGQTHREIDSQNFTLVRQILSICIRTRQIHWLFMLVSPYLVIRFTLHVCVTVLYLVLPRYINIVIYVMTCSYIVICHKQKSLSILYLLIRNTEIHCLLHRLGYWAFKFSVIVQNFVLFSFLVR